MSSVSTPRKHQLMTSYIRGESNKEKKTDTHFNPSSSHTVTAVPTGPPVGALVATPIAQPQIEEQSEEADKEKSVAVTVFGDHINAGKMIQMADLKSLMNATLYLQRLANKLQKVKQLNDFVCHKTQVKRQLSAELESDYDFVSATSSGQWKSWEEHDLKCIESGEDATKDPGPGYFARR